MLKLNQSGSMLLGTSLALGVLGLGLFAFVNSVQRSIQSASQAELLSSVVGARSYLRRQVSCGATLRQAGSSCNEDRGITAYSEDGKKIIPFPSSRLGFLEVRTLCGPKVGLDRIKVEYRVLNSKNTAWRDLYNAIPFECSGAMLEDDYWGEKSETSSDDTASLRSPSTSVRCDCTTPSGPEDYYYCGSESMPNCYKCSGFRVCAW